MRTVCPHCKSEVNGNKGDLIRCEVCKKVFEAKVIVKVRDNMAFKPPKDDGTELVPIRVNKKRSD